MADDKEPRIIYCFGISSEEPVTSVPLFSNGHCGSCINDNFAMRVLLLKPIPCGGI